MKKTLLILVISLISCGSAFGAALSLEASWAANTESDMKECRLHRTDGTRTLVGTIAHPTTLYNFSVTVRDHSAATLTFVSTGVDMNNNESSDSTPASYSYNLDTNPPSSHKNLSVQK